MMLTAELLTTRPFFKFGVPRAISRFIYVYFWAADSYRPFGICERWGSSTDTDHGQDGPQRCPYSRDIC